MGGVSVGTWLASLTGAGVGVAVTVVIVVGIRRQWTREKLVEALLFPVTIAVVLTAISVVLINRDLGPSRLRWFAPAGPIYVLVILLWERGRLRRRTR